MTNEHMREIPVIISHQTTLCQGHILAASFPRQLSEGLFLTVHIKPEMKRVKFTLHVLTSCGSTFVWPKFLSGDPFTSRFATLNHISQSNGAWFICPLLLGKYYFICTGPLNHVEGVAVALIHRQWPLMDGQTWYDLFTPKYCAVGDETQNSKTKNRLDIPCEKL